MLKVLNMVPLGDAPRLGDQVETPAGAHGRAGELHAETLRERPGMFS
jgi:hypothetical protein